MPKKTTWSAAYLSRKNSTQNKPVEIYEVYLGSQTEVDNDTLFFNTSNHSFEFYPIADTSNKQVYVALGLQRGTVNRSIDGSINNLSVTLDNVSRTFSTLFNQLDLLGKRIVVRQIYMDCLTNYYDYDMIFDGIIDSPSLSPDEGLKVEIKASFIDNLDFILPLEALLTTCNNRFTDCKCANGISATALKDTKTGQTIDTIITQACIQDAARTEGTGDYWNPGILEMTGGTPGNIGYKRRIVDQSGDILFLESNFPVAMQIGDEYTIERDCDKAFESCKNKFNNTVNYRGFRYLPTTLVQRKV